MDRQVLQVPAVGRLESRFRRACFVTVADPKRGRFRGRDSCFSRPGVSADGSCEARGTRALVHLVATDSRKRGMTSPSAEPRL